MKIIEKTKDFVEAVLKEFPEARDNDFLLCVHVYMKMGYAHRIPLGIVLHYENIEFAPSFETITRMRREIQHNEGRYPSSEFVTTQRKVQRDEFNYRYSSKGRADSFPNSQFMP